MTLVKDASEQAKRFIDASLKGRAKPPSQFAPVPLSEFITGAHMSMAAAA